VVDQKLVSHHCRCPAEVVRRVAESVDNVADFMFSIQVSEIKRLVFQTIYVDYPEKQLPIDAETVPAELTVLQGLLLRRINSLDQVQKVCCFCSIKLETTNNNRGVLVCLFKLFLELLKLERGNASKLISAGIVQCGYQIS
jgi:hypothetical protein